MYIRLRTFGKPDVTVVVASKLTTIDQFRRIIKDKIAVDVNNQRLFYGGKLLEDGYTFHDYNIKLNDVIQLMPKLQASQDDQSKDSTKSPDQKTTDKDDTDVEYDDATSIFYTVGDLIDMKDREQGTWFEGKIVRIVSDPNFKNSNDDIGENKSSDKDSDSENKPELNTSSTVSPKTKPRGIAKYFTKSPVVKKKTDNGAGKSTDNNYEKSEKHVLYQIQLDGCEEESNTYCKFSEIRPRARKEIPAEDLKPNMTVMINHNTEDVMEKGYWYDFTVNEVKKLRTSHELIGTLYLGPDSVPQNDTVVRVHDKIFAIEQAVPLDQKTDEYRNEAAQIMKRTYPLNCLKCRDNEDKLCKWCGCFLCAGKENPEKIVLCDECNNGYHMKCLDPPLAELPDEDWYCPSCKRDTNEVIAPGAAKQTKKTVASKSNRDWGRGMACVGKTKSSAMPANHFGPIPGIEVGMCWRFRIQLSESGVHRPPVSGIHGRDVEGAYSIVLSGGYEDDVDHGIEFTYTGSGGRDLSGNKRTAEQSCDQTLTRENKALARNCSVQHISQEGGDAGVNWRSGKPVRVVRSYKMLKHFPKYAPKEGIRYDGIYKVVKYYPEKGKSGFRVWKYLLRRDDPTPAPWEQNAKQFPIVYPEGYLEAEAEKKALKEKANSSTKKSAKKRALFESNKMVENSDVSSPPSKKQKREDPAPKKGGGTSKKIGAMQPSVMLMDIFKKPPANAPSQSTETEVETSLSSDITDAINADTFNEKLWKDCLQIFEKKGKQDFVQHVTEVFLCIICQEVAAHPVTTPCLHNFCMGCLKLAFRATSSHSCPCCRQNLATTELAHNERLKAALQAILPGYDVGKK